MLRECSESENRILKECIGDILTDPELIGAKRNGKGGLPGNHFFVNGAIILNHVVYPKEGAELTVAEDDLKDALGRPVCIRYPVPGNLSVTAGQRILVVYSDNGAYIPMRLTVRTGGMIPSAPPAYFYQTDWNHTMKLPHPAALRVDRKSYRMNEKETKDFAKTCNSLTNIRVKNWVGIILMSLLILMLFGILFIALVAEEVITKASVALALGIVLFLVWGLLTFGTAKAILAGLTRGLKRLHYKKKVLFVNSYTNIGYGGVPASYLNVYEYVGGELKMQSYYTHNNVFLPKNIPYGRVINKFSEDAESNEKGLNYFWLDK